MLGRKAKGSHNDDPEARILSQISKLEQTLLNTQKRGDLMEESRLCNNIAKQWESIGEWRKALQFHLFDKQISEAAGDAEGFCTAVGNMAQVFVEMGLKEMAMEMRREQLKWAKKCQDPVSIFRVHVAFGLGKLSEVESIINIPELVKKEILSEASVHFFHAQESLDAYVALIEAGLLVKSRRKEADALKKELDLYDCRLLVLKGNVDAALTKSLILEQWAIEMKNDTFLFEVLGVKGMAYGRINEHVSAIQRCYDVQLEISKKLDSVDLKVESLHNLLTAYKKLRDYDLAVNTLYLYRDLLKIQINDEMRMKEINDEIQELVELKDLQMRVERIKIKMTNSKNPQKYLRDLAVDCKRLGLFQECLEYSLTEFEQNGQDEECLLLIIESLIELKHAKDAIYYCQKLTCLYENKGIHGGRGAFALLLLAKSFWLLPTLPGDVLHILQKACSMLECEDRNLWNILECLSLLALSYARLGVDEMYLKTRDLCMTKYQQLFSENNQTRDKEISSELASLDYFATRKASKNVMKLVDGHFNMKSRTRANLRGPKIRTIRRVKNSSEEEMVEEDYKKTARVVRKSNRIIESDCESLNDFIVNDNEENSVIRDKTSSKTSLILLSETEDHGDYLPPVPYKKSNYMYNLHDDTSGLVWPPSPKKTLSHSEVSIEYYSGSGGGKGKLTKPFIDPGVISSVLRLIIIIEGHDPLIIPVVDEISERKSIGWLIEEIKYRFKVDLDKEPIIEALFTEEGARLSSLDPIALILSDNQRVIVRISGFKTKTFKEILDSVLTEAGISFNNDFYGILIKRVEGEGLVDLSNWRWPEIWMTLSLRSLITLVTHCPNTIRSVNLCNNHFSSNVLLIEFLNLVGSNLTSLDVSFTTPSKDLISSTMFTSLTCLKMSFIESTIFEDSSFLDCLSRKALKLRQLELCGLDLRNAGLECLHYITSLETLDLSYSLLPSQLMLIKDLLSKSASIKRIVLTDEKIKTTLLGLFPRVKFEYEDYKMNIT